jgi:hypothetical protein
MSVSNKLNVENSQANKVEKGFENMRDDTHWGQTPIYPVSKLRLF